MPHALPGVGKIDPPIKADDRTASLSLQLNQRRIAGQKMNRGHLRRQTGEHSSGIRENVVAIVSRRQTADPTVENWTAWQPASICRSRYPTIASANRSSRADHSSGQAYMIRLVRASRRSRPLQSRTKPACDAAPAKNPTAECCPVTVCERAAPCRKRSPVRPGRRSALAAGRRACGPGSKSSGRRRPCTRAEIHRLEDGQQIGKQDRRVDAERLLGGERPPPPARAACTARGT